MARALAEPSRGARSLLVCRKKSEAETPRSGRQRLRGRYGLMAFDAASRVGEASSLMDETSHHDAMRLILGDGFVKSRPHHGVPMKPSMPLIMGILNVTPDSFSDGGQHGSFDAAVSHGLAMAAAGAHVLDVGGESTRPGSDPVSVDDEIGRVVPVIRALKSRWDGPISIDTMKPEVARAAVEAGAGIWNDVSALSHAPDSLSVAAELGCEVVLMHMKGEPRTMQDAPHYEDVVAEVVAHLRARAEAAIAAGVERKAIWLDPGIGFAKTADHNLKLTRHLSALVDLGFPVLYAASRKRVIQAVDDTADQATDRLGGSLALALEGAMRGAAMVRVHDVRETVQALKVQAAVTTA